MFVLCAAPAGGGQVEPLSASAHEALVLCHAAEEVPVGERIPMFTDGLERAEHAVRIAPHDAVAHFAVFCNLGKRLQLQGRESGWLSGLRELRRARRELDTALALAPDYPAALAAKGKMLSELPRWLGGDEEEGERLLRRAVALQPDDPQLRNILATAQRTADAEP
jgi:hypothetical protein